jgi:hypothetical protein
MYDLLLVL